MNPSDAVSEMFAVFEQVEVRYATLEEAWAQSRYTEPLLGYLLARFPEPVAFDQVLQFMAAAGTALGEIAMVHRTMADLRTATVAERNRAASAAGDARNQAVMAQRPVAAALADAIAQVLEVWADPEDEQGGNAPFDRAMDAVAALISALQIQQGSAEQDQSARSAARAQLLTIFRQAVPMVEV